MCSGCVLPQTIIRNKETPVFTVHGEIDNVINFNLAFKSFLNVVKSVDYFENF